MTDDIFIDEPDPIGDQKLQQVMNDILPIYEWNVFGYSFPIYVQIGWFRRMIINLIFGSKFRRLRNG